MQTLKQLGGGLGLAMLSAIFVIGGILLALAEGNSQKPTLVFPTETEAPFQIPSLEATSLEFLLTAYPSDTPTAGNTGAATQISSIVPSLTYTVIPCGAPAGWIQYTVQPGDNLYQISLRYRLSVSELQSANCLGSSTVIYSGQKLWVPNVATSTPPATSIIIEFPTATLIPSNTPTPTTTSTPTTTPSSTATSTATPTATPTTTSTSNPPQPPP